MRAGSSPGDPQEVSAVSGSGVRAVRWHARRDVRCENVGIAPEPGPGEARVRVAWCGLCGSAVHEYLNGPFQIPQVPHVVTGRAAPITLGPQIPGWGEPVGPRPTDLPQARPFRSN